MADTGLHFKVPLYQCLPSVRNSLMKFCSSFSS